MTYRLGIIGAGNMGSAIIRGALQSGIVQPGEVIVAEIDSSRRNSIDALGVVTSNDVRDTAGAAQILLAVKPQSFANVVAPLAPLESSTVVISIMAGLSSERIRGALGENARVIRAMPNVAAQIKYGVTAIALGEGANQGDEQFAVELFNSVGTTVSVDESHMYAVTALSGSGPAYVFLLAESMEQAGIQLGLDRSSARLLAYETIHGAGRLLVQSNDTDADALRQSVTSPGGTTAAALELLFERELPQIVSEAILAARDRGIDLDH